LKSGEKNCLSWKFTISALIPYKEELIYVDAISGEVINQVSLIYDDNATGSAQTQYSGTKAIITNRVSDSDFRLNESRNNVSIQTLNMQRQLSPGSSVPFSDNDNSWTATEYNNQYHDQAALDAHWANEIVLDYWKNIRKRNSINGSGMAILSYVHWDLNYNNAKWDGTNNIILYGDGDGITFRPLVSLDVAAHEFGHGICQYTAGLVNGAVESAAINEGFSDIWGAVIEGWAAPTKQKWFSGEDIVLSSPGYLRSMSNPHDGLEGKVDTYNGTYWYSGTDANTYSHTNLGVLNHWFYLLSEGGTGWNNGLTSHAPVGSGYNWAVGSIGINDAARLAYITEAHYLNSTANYATLRTQSITAAADTFGVNSAQLISATNAWYAVGVGNRFQYASNINVTGNFLICSSGAQYTVNNPPPQTTITWTCSNNIQRVSNQGTNPCTFQSLGGNGSGWIEATLTIGTSVTTLPRKDVWVGRFESTVVTGQAAVCPGNLYTYTAQVPGGHNPNYSYSWTYPSNWIFYTQYDNVLRLQTPLYNPIYGTVRVAITNCWGTSGYSGITVYPGSGCPRYFTIFPNPASDNITITLVDNSESISDTTYHSQNVAESSTQNNFTVRIYNRHGSLISISKRSGTSFTVPLTNMRDGTYVIELSDGKSSSTQTLIVNKK
jgi:Zn-dependent metalloprotease